MNLAMDVLKNFMEKQETEIQQNVEVKQEVQDNSEDQKSNQTEIDETSQHSQMSFGKQKTEKLSEEDQKKKDQFLQHWKQRYDIELKPQLLDFYKKQGYFTGIALTQIMDFELKRFMDKADENWRQLEKNDSAIVFRLADPEMVHIPTQEVQIQNYNENGELEHKETIINK